MEPGGEIIRLRGFVGCVCHGVLLNLIDRFGQGDRTPKKKKGKAVYIRSFPAYGFEFD
jgi:hypothetical protein